MNELFKVVVSQRVDYLPDRNETRDSIDQQLVNWLSSLHLAVYPVPNTLTGDVVSNKESDSIINPLNEWLDVIKPNAIVLSGGNTIGEVLDRDRTEQFLLDWAQQQRKPVLGICRGMQMLAVYDGCELVNISGHVRTRHQLTIQSGDVSFYKPESVNSYHDQAVSRCPDSYEVFAVSEDGNIEAIRHKDLPWQGWMWHPERESPFSEKDNRNIQTLFNLQ